MTPANDNDAERKAALAAALRRREQERLKRRPPQELDTGALPLFGDQRRQIDLMDLLR